VPRGNRRLTQQVRWYKEHHQQKEREQPLRATLCGQRESERSELSRRYFIHIFFLHLTDFKTFFM